MVIRSFTKVFGKIRYILLALIVSLIAFSFTVWFPNIPLIVKFMGHEGVSFSEKINLPINLLKSISTNFTFLSASFTIIISFLFGINVSLLAYFLKKKITQVKQNNYITGFLGTISGILGMGCAACGSLLLTSLLSIFGASSIIAFLPLRGGEFNIIAIILLGISIYTISKQIDNPSVCKI